MLGNISYLGDHGKVSDKWLWEIDDGDVTHLALSLFYRRNEFMLMSSMIKKLIGVIKTRCVIRAEENEH